MNKLVCPSCPNDKPDVVRFLDDDGQAKLAVTCRELVHGDGPLEVVYPDPNAPAAAAGGSAQGRAAVALVHELLLYDKLTTIVMELSARYGCPVEYGVVEHHFAFAYPKDYRLMADRWSHNELPGSGAYTLSTYIALALGRLNRLGEVRYWPSHGTGRWEYDSEISAWSAPHILSPEPMLSWEAFAAGLEDEAPWPAAQFMAATPL